MSALIFKINPLALFLIAFADMFSVYVLFASNLELSWKVLLFSAFILLHFLICGFEYWRIKLEEEVEKP